MREDMKLLAVLVVIIVDFVSSEYVLFPAGTTLQTVDPEAIGEIASEYDDPKHTGSYLFDSAANNIEMERLALTIVVSHFKSENDRYFRAHPVLIECAEKVMVDLTNQDTQLRVISGYKTKSDVGSSQSVQDMYAMAGTAIQLTFRPTITGQLISIAESALKHCPLIFERHQRDLGLIMMSGHVHIHMTEADGNGMYLGVDGYTGSHAADFKDWALQQIDDGLDPEATDTCDSFTGLDANAVYPTGSASPEAVVGKVDKPITRSATEDFDTLVQYPSRTVDFEDEERTASWCGTEGNPCPDCRSKPLGNSRTKRCANRLMSPRMFGVIKVLQKLVRQNLNQKLKIMYAFDEARDGHVPDKTSLRTEGRLLKLQLSGSNSAADIKTLTKLALCAEADYIKNEGASILVAVRKAVGFNSEKLTFPESSLLIVAPPSSEKDIYKLPSHMDESKHPLLDPFGQEGQDIAGDTPLGLFASKDSAYRYLRLHPRIAMCYAKLKNKINKWNKVGDEVKNIDVVHAYMSAEEQILKIDPMDQRFDKFSSGTGMEIRLGLSDPDATQDLPSLISLLKMSVDMCGPLFHDAGMAVGVGLYLDRVFICMQDDFDFWTDDESLIPSGYNHQHFRNMLQERYTLATQSRLVDPDDFEEACNNADPPALQSVDFKHKHSSGVLRRRRAAPSPDECVPSSSSQFCKDTAPIRQNYIEVMSKEIARKWLYHDRDEFQAAFEKCFKLCGTCMDGAIWDEKMENCNNFLHWVPFELLNEHEISNVFARDNIHLRRYASQNGLSIEDTPLFHVVYNTVGAVYRPDPKTSIQEELYPQTENPSPVLELLLKIFCIHASGTVKFWVADELDTISLKEAFKVVMLYNKNVTDVEVFVMKEASMDAVQSTIEKFVSEWSTGSCPLYTREFISKTTIHSLPHNVGKRSDSLAVGENIINYYNSWEHRWVNQEL